MDSGSIQVHPNGDIAIITDTGTQLLCVGSHEHAALKNVLELANKGQQGGGEKGKILTNQMRRLEKRKRKLHTNSELAELDNYMYEANMDVVRKNPGRLAIPNIKMKFRNLSVKGVTPMEIMEKCFDIIIRKGISIADGNLETTKIVVGLSHPQLMEKSFWMCNRTYQMINGFTLHNEIARIMQSNKELVIDEHFEMDMHILKNQNNHVGGCRSKCKKVNNSLYADQRCGAKAFVLGEGQCLLKAVAIAMANHNYQNGGIADKKYWRSITRYPIIQKDAARVIEETSGLEHKQEHSIEDLKQIAECYPDWNFLLFERNSFSSTATKIEEMNPGKTKYVTLLYFDNHYDFVKKSKSVINSRCPDCNKIIELVYYVDTPHICGNSKFCRKCRNFVSNEHNCCFNPPQKKERENSLKKQEKFLKVVYDVETITIEEKEGKFVPLPAHIVNTICWETWCHDCVEGEKCKSCPGSGSINHYDVSGRETVISKFTDMLLHNEKFNKAIVLAHNGGCYDHYFVIGEMIFQHGRFPQLTRKGRKIIVAHLPGENPKFGGERCNQLTFKDSLNFLPMALSKLPAAFGIKEMAKGFYPHFFNTPENYGKVLNELPPLEYYNVLSMQNPEGLIKFHEKNRMQKFDCDGERLKYCQSDVQITMAALKKFCEICKKELGGWDPIVSAATIPSFVMHLMKFEHIKSGEIGYIPENGFPKRTQSKLAIKYLFWLSKMTGQKIQHLRCGGEKRIIVESKTFYVDGYDEKNNEIIEIYGCCVHGCLKCNQPDARNPLDTIKTNGEILEETIKRQAILEKAGYVVKVVWEHEIREQMASNRNMKQFFAQCRHTSCLRPRDAMYGGRTQPFKYILIADKCENIRYLDFCSLYPFVNMTAAYPTGQPEIITENFDYASGSLQYRGLVYCDVNPSKNLELPILPYRAGGKLLFPLCRSCAENMDASSECTHRNVQQRYLTGTWYSEELKLALENGYELLRIHEVWHWDDSKWQTGWPSGVVTEEERLKHIQDIENTDGVKLTYEKIEKNPALRSMAKLFLNSAWEYEMTSLDDIQHDITMISRMKLDDYLDTKKYANVVFGVITTAVARLILYGAMKMVGHERLGYCDTDSIVFIEKDGENLCGDLVGTGLGKLESEVPEGLKIAKFVAVAPKCYCYELTKMDGTHVKFVIKAKGVTLDAANSNIVTFGEMERMAKELIAEQHIEPIHAKVRGMKKKMLVSITNYETRKIVQPVVDKLRLCKDGTTLPHGYNNNEIIRDYLFE
ncbi:unnamed protein product [Caenorhabditis angaria]|uniref:DNA-directed DNA polymerase n=1 Tax=Caenorhabditis angaria TaxID=860376 RepID=A0A9P1N5V1_9PELO|nr:unnamed protein product [Caenorhabditis angaria]